MFSTQTFSATAFTQADGTGTTQGAAQKKGRQEDKHTCLPVTVRAIEQAAGQRAEAGGELHFHGTEPGMLLLVGLVEAVTRQAASIEFSLNDATGRIKARHYLTGQAAKELEDLAPGHYVSTFGNVRTAPEVHFAAAGVSLVMSADEVSYHMIESAYAALKLQKGSAVPVTPAPQRVLLQAETTPTKAEATRMPGMPAVPEAATPALPKERLSGSALRKAIHGFIQKEGEGKPEGMSFAAVCNHVDPTPADAVSAALEKLVDAGELFTTIDDGHFQCL